MLQRNDNYFIENESQAKLIYIEKLQKKILLFLLLLII